MTLSEIHEWCLEAVGDWIDDDHTVPRGPFCSKQHLKEQAQSNDAPYTPEQVVSAAETIIGAGGLLDWVGLLVPTDRDRLVDVIEYERNEAEITRHILIGKANKYLTGETEAFVDAE